MGSQTKQMARKSEPFLRALIEKNHQWANSVVAEKPSFFKSLANQQSPKIFWIGCADSRVASNVLLDLPPGEVFVHRNVANVVSQHDLNCLSVLQFAVEVLKVEHVIVCGHYSCGGVKASMEDAPHGLVDHWISGIRGIYKDFEPALSKLSDKNRWEALCDINVGLQVRNVSSTTVMRGAWERKQNVAVHGWIYNVGDGLLQDLGLTVEDIDQTPNPQAFAQRIIEKYQAKE